MDSSVSPPSTTGLIALEGAERRSARANVPQERRPVVKEVTPRVDSAKEVVSCELVSPARCAALEVPWQDLVAHAVEPNPFYEPWMVLPAVEHLPTSGELRFLFVWGQPASAHLGRPRLLGLFPLVEQSAGPLKGSLYTMWQHRYSYLGTPLVRRGREREVVQALFDWLAKQPRSPLLRLDQFPGDGVLRRTFVDEIWRRAWPSFVGSTCTRAFFRPAANAEAYLQEALRGKRRKELRRLHSRLCELGKVQFTEVGVDEDPRCWTEEFLALEARGWKGRTGVAVASQANELQFFRAMMGHAGLRDRLMLLALRLDGQAIAMKVNILGGDGGFAFKIAYDEGMARFSPGVLLEIVNIERLHQRQDVRWMDSCASPNRFLVNQLWNDRREFQTLFVAPDAPKPSLLMAALPAARWLKRWVIHRRPPRDVQVQSEERDG